MRVDFPLDFAHLIYQTFSEYLLFLSSVLVVLGIQLVEYIMDIDTITNFIKNLGQRDFESVVSLILRRFFGLTAIKVNGSRDGGSDWRAFKDTGESTTIAYQTTVQDSKWKEKALDDARKAVAKVGATRYFYLTSRRHTSIDLRELENQINSELKIPATCLGAKELAGFVVEGNLVGEFLNAINTPILVSLDKRPDKQEILLHSYVAISTESRELRTTVYDDTILIALYSEGSLYKADLVRHSLDILGCAPEKADVLSRRVDSLRARDYLVSLPEGKVGLAPHMKQELDSAARVYSQEFDTLAAIQADLMSRSFGIVWTPMDAQFTSVLLARAFIQKQLESVGKAGVQLNSLGFTRHIGDSLQELRQHLLNHSVPRSQLEDTLGELLDQATDNPLVQKLTRAAIYAALEGGDPISGAKVIGAHTWSEVKVMLDASVAIPYLCASLYQPSSGRFSSHNYHGVTSLRDVGAALYIPHQYLRECAWHLLIALRYEYLSNLTEDLNYSQNGYVSHYYRLKQAGVDVPNTIRDYLVTFAPSGVQSGSKEDIIARKVMSELQPLLQNYGVEHESVTHVPTFYRKDVETEYTFRLQERQISKPSHLLENDVLILAHIIKKIREKGEHWMFLTWDRTTIGVAKVLSNCGWVVGPDIACDFTQAYRPLSESHLCALAHSIARSREKPLEISARVIDRIVQIASDDKLHDWRLQKEITRFREELLSSINLESEYDEDWIDKQTTEFLKRVGIEPSTQDLSLNS
jgi:hypothetical protein